MSKAMKYIWSKRIFSSCKLGVTAKKIPHVLPLPKQSASHSTVNIPFALPEIPRTFDGLSRKVRVLQNWLTSQQFSSAFQGVSHTLRYQVPSLQDCVNTIQLRYAQLKIVLFCRAATCVISIMEVAAIGVMPGGFSRIMSLISSACLASFMCRVVGLHYFLLLIVPLPRSSAVPTQRSFNTQT